ncbi:hypothetical protein GCM10027037_09370 [Mucilaginibacter koreensis]
MEIWGGMECTINRVGSEYFDQLDYSGHYIRNTDIASFANLGIKKIRYPVIWEKHQPTTSTEINWLPTAEKLHELVDAGIQPIAGLVHHGSGPAYVSFMDDSFAEGLAAYASKVAQQFPWLEYYTPINEPLTTARFCGLYGVWYPHGHDDYTFLKVLLSECKATVLAMQAIRKVNPSAKLVQTDDLGKIHSTPLLQYQADFENERRWLSYDLLCGKVTPDHALWNYIINTGISKEEIEFFIENNCPPDIMGINHYITSERFLDENTSHYPPHVIGGNGKHQYADVETVRVDKAQPDGPYRLIMEAWKRYQLPIAITEVHLHCTREEQLRWFNYIWKAANNLQKDGVDMRGVTSWALLGSFGWNKLLTQPNGTYEAGAFDVVSGTPRATAICQMVSKLAKGESFQHPVLCQDGWWNRDSRIIYRFNQFLDKPIYKQDNCPPLLITGKTGTLGKAFARICEQRSIKYELLDREGLDITNPLQIEQAIQSKQPWAIINTAGFVRVDDAEAERDACFLSNTNGPENLAILCEKYGVKLMTFSTDLVFDGSKNDSYHEHDYTNPLNVYGESKARAELLVKKHNPEALIIRTSAFFGPWDVYNFAYGTVRSLIAGEAVHPANDVYISPTYVPDLVNTSLDLLIDNEQGVWHLANSGTISWTDLALEIAQRQHLDKGLVEGVNLQELGLKAKRPKFTSMKSNRGTVMPSVDDALTRYFNEQEVLKF